MVRAQVPIVVLAAAADAEPRPDAAAVVEVQQQVVSDARVRRADEPAVAAVRGGRQEPAVARADAEARPSEPGEARRGAAAEERLSVVQEVPAVARPAGEPSAVSCLLEPFADRERPAPSETMTMVRHERIATWKMQRSRAVSISVWSYPPFDGCPSARFIDATRRHARWTDNGEAAMWRDAR